MTARPRAWAGAVALGGWLSLAAVWPAVTIRVGDTHFLWQPLLLLSLMILTGARARRVGWAAAAGASVFLYLIVTLAGWLPFLRAPAYTVYEYAYPRVYEYYLWLYEGGLAALIGFQAFSAVSGRTHSWWPSGSWSRPLVMAPVLLLIRAIQLGPWVIPLVGIAVGLILAAVRPWRVVSSTTRFWKLAPWGLVLFATLLVCGSGLRIYQRTGLNDFLRDSDDGSSYYGQAVQIAEDPGVLWRSPPLSMNFFSLYPPIMAVWFMVVGPHVPSWLFWQGVAGGFLVLFVYWLGCWLGGRLTGLVAAGLVATDHVLLHLMGTLNVETFFIPALYAAIWLWASVDAQPPEQRTRRCFLAGLMLAISALFRPTSALLPFAWLILLCWERPRQPWHRIRAEGGWMIAGFAIPVVLLLIRHRFAWGHWTLGASRGSSLSWGANYGWTIQGQHPYRIGFGPWWEMLIADPSVIWREMIPNWWTQILYLWTHRGFGQMDLIQGLNQPGPYQAALAGFLAVGAVLGIVLVIRRRSRADLAVAALLPYFTSLALVYYVINSRYRAPFLPALYLLACLGFSTFITAIRSRVASGGWLTARQRTGEVSA